MKHLLIVTAPMLLTACLGNRTPEPVVVTQTEFTKQSVPIQAQPKGVAMPPVDWYVVNGDNVDEFLERIKNDTGAPVFFAITPKGYENLAIGIGDLRRYIKDEQAIIGYYEEALTEE
jgi:C4-dicarboxylate-specific signal transduction histidine kinase